MRTIESPNVHKGYQLIDFSNLGFAAAAGPVLSVGEQQTQAIFGFLRMLRPLVAMYPMLKPIVLGDGRSWRYDIFPDYKAKRAKEAETKSEIMLTQVRKSFHSQRSFIQEALGLLGVPYLVAMNLEADDLAGILCRRYVAAGNKVMLISGDKDWIQLVASGVGWLDPRSDAKVKRVNIRTLEEQLGVATPQQWLEMKALIGDKSDEIPGVGGIGDKGAIELLMKHGSVTSFINGVIDGSIDEKSLPKKFRDLVANEDKIATFRVNMDLMDLNSPKIPRPVDLRLQKGELNVSAFHDFCEKWHFKSILKDIDGWCEPFKGVST